MSHPIVRFTTRSGGTKHLAPALSLAAARAEAMVTARFGYGHDVEICLPGSNGELVPVERVVDGALVDLGAPVAPTTSPTYLDGVEGVLTRMAADESARGGRR